MKLSDLHYIQLLDEARQALITKDDNTTNYLKEIENRLSAGEEAVKKVAELEKEIKEWENSRDGFLLSSQAKNFKIMELEKEAKRKVDLFAKKCFECSELENDKRELVEALDKISNPIFYLRKEAESSGGTLNGFAVQLSNDANYLKGIARTALAKHKEAR